MGADMVFVDAAVSAVDGVEESYAATPTPARVIRRLADADQPLAAVKGSEVTVSIGVLGANDSAEIARRVAAAVRAATGAEPLELVRVRVSRLIADDERPAELS